MRRLFWIIAWVIENFAQGQSLQAIHVQSEIGER